jgi:hypothetical protein
MSLTTPLVSSSSSSGSRGDGASPLPNIASAGIGLDWIGFDLLGRFLPSGNDERGGGGREGICFLRVIFELDPDLDRNHSSRSVYLHLPPYIGSRLITAIRVFT